MPRPDDSAHAYALRLLTARAYSTRELQRRLARRGISQTESNTVVGNLTRSGLLDDARYAEQFARGKIVNDSASPRRVALLLARKGIERTVADAAVARVVEDERIDPVVAAERVAKRKLASLEGLDPRVARQRLYAYLARRGYDVDVIRVVSASVLE